MQVDSAFTSGDAPPLIAEKMYSEIVWAELPEQKNAKMKSSSEMMKTRSADAIKAGFSRGSVILKKVCVLDAPRSRDASFNIGSSSLYLDVRMGIV